jgi:hypothetical protein
MENLGAQRVLYCHAQDITDPALIGHNREYFDELESRCAAVLATGTMPDDVEQLDDPARAVGWPFEDALPPIESLDEQPDPDGHNQAIKAMLRWLRSTGAR